MEEASFVVILINILKGLVFPIIVCIVQQWISKKNIKEKYKGMSYWKMETRREFSFVDIELAAYKYFSIICIIVYGLKGILNIFGVNKISLIGWEILYCSIAALFVLYVRKNVKFRKEMLVDKKKKWELIILIFVIQSVPILSEVSNGVYIFNILFWGMLLLGWAYCVLEYCDVVRVIEYQYADIYLSENEIIRGIETENIKKKGKWILVKQGVGETRREIRILETQIVRIDYYGEPIIDIEKRKLFKNLMWNK